MIAFPENWKLHSFSIRGEIVVVSCATASCPGTRVCVVAMLGTGVLKNSPPASVVSLWSWV